jgi:hypothetical protein
MLHSGGIPFVKLWPIFVLILACVLAPAASANSTYTWNFATAPNASLGVNTYTYYSGGIGITATGTSDLYYKSVGGIGGASETGLGLACCNSDHEIEPGESIIFNMGSLFSKNVTGITLMLGSLQSGETGQVCDAFSVCVIFTSANDAKSLSIMALYTDMKIHNSGLLTVTSGSGDVLVNQLQVTTSPVPEPSSLLMMGSGLVAMAGIVRRKLRI